MMDGQNVDAKVSASFKNTKKKSETLMNFFLFLGKKIKIPKSCITFQKNLKPIFLSFLKLCFRDGRGWKRLNLFCLLDIKYIKYINQIEQKIDAIFYRFVYSFIQT